MLGDSKIQISPLSIYKVLIVLNDSRVLMSHISRPGPEGYIDLNIAPIAISCFIPTIVSLNTIRLLPVH